MSCSGAKPTLKKPDSSILLLWVDMVYWLTTRLFHSFYPKGSERRHRQVMRLFQYCADRAHSTACSVYGHILLFRGVTPWDKQQGVEYLKYAAKQGDAKAAYQLAELMKNQKFGLGNDPVEIASLLIKASQQNHLLAKKALMAVYRENKDCLDKILTEADKDVIHQCSLER